MLEPALRADRALLHAHGAGTDPPPVALDTVAIVHHILPTRLTLSALAALKARHCGDGLRKDPAAPSSVWDLTLLHAVQCALVHDDDPGAAHNLEVQWTGELAGLQHGLARFEYNVLGFHGRHLAVDPEPAQRHAAFTAAGASQRRQKVTPILRPALRVVEQVDQPLFHCPVEEDVSSDFLYWPITVPGKCLF